MILQCQVRVPREECGEDKEGTNNVRDYSKLSATKIYRYE